MLSLESIRKKARIIDEESARLQTDIKWIPSREEESIQLSRPKHPLQRGHDVMDQLRKYCDSLDTPMKFRSPNQVLIQNRLSGAIARLVYGADLLRYEKEIIRYNGFTTIRQEVATTMPRRSGKSQSVAEWIACAMLAVPGFDGACFSNSARAAGKEKGMLGIVRDTLVKRFGMDERRFTLDNSECIQFSINGDKRTLHSYPGACHTLRGVGGNVIIVEEASYVTNEAFRELIIPLMALSNVCFCALSTLGAKSAGWFNKLIESGLVDSFKVEYVCAACYEKGIRNPCIHKVDALPHWGAEDRVSLMNKMYGEENRDVYLREVMGIVEDISEGRVFSKRKIQEALTSPFVEFNRAVHRIFISIDPCGGSEVEEKSTSDWTALAFCEPYTTYLGMLKLTIVDTAGYRDDLYQFIRRIREQDEYLTDATLIVGVEMSNGFAAPDIYAFIRSKFTNVETLNNAGSFRKQGITTTDKAKVQMVELTNETLNRDQIRFYKKFVTTDPNPAKLREEWARQMTEFRRIFIKGNTIRQRNTYVLTGKGEDKKGKDDLAMATLIGLRMRYLYDFDPEFRKARGG
jgi:hypothetical protein